MILFDNIGVRIKFIPIKDFLGDGGEGILIQLYFFFLDVSIIFIISILLVVDIGTKWVVSAAFVTACTLVVVAVRKVEVDVAT